MSRTKALHFLGTFIFSGIILGTPFTVQAIANNVHIQQKDDKDKKAGEKNNNKNQSDKDKSDKNSDKDKKQNNNNDDKNKKNNDNDNNKPVCDDLNGNNEDSRCVTPTPMAPTPTPEAPEPTKIIRVIHGPIINEPVSITEPSSSNNSSTTTTTNTNNNFEIVQTPESSPQINVNNTNNPNFSNSNTITINNDTKTN